jgi:uncharacterized coiled-coil DUF342 family protein
MTNESLERRIAKLESLITNESLSADVFDEMIAKLGEMNKSNQLDNGNFRWSTAVNLLMKLEDFLAEDFNDYDKRAVRYVDALQRYGYSSAADLVNEMIIAINKKMEDFKSAKNDLKEIFKAAKDFDKTVNK